MTTPSQPTETRSPSLREALRTRQASRVRLYREHPREAWTIDSAATAANGADPDDPMHATIAIASGFDVRLDIGVHRNLGGLHDRPTPGDVLCAALAACAESTFRVVASQLGLRLSALAVRVEGEVDVRGSLCVAPEVPVGFQRMRVEVQSRADDADPRVVRKLEAAAEHCCIVLQTLRAGVPVEVTFGHAAP
jgi:uncharacterized OsmC-like protein